MDTRRLIEAAQTGDAKLVKSLIDAGANVDLQDRDGNTALIWAAYSGYKDIVIMLVEAGANINHKNKKNDTALMFAHIQGFDEVEQYLKEHEKAHEIVVKALQACLEDDETLIKEE